MRPTHQLAQLSNLRRRRQSRKPLALTSRLLVGSCSRGLPYARSAIARAALYGFPLDIRRHLPDLI